MRLGCGVSEDLPINFLTPSVLAFSEFPKLCSKNVKPGLSLYNGRKSNVNI